MKEVKDSNQKTPKKPLIFYYMVALVIILLLNAFLFPSMLENQVVEVPYNEFLDMVDNKEVKQVALDETNSELTFTTGEEKNTKYYKTGIWPDDGQRLLTQLRENSDIEFTAEIPTQSSPILNFIIEWVLPLVFFIGIGELLSRMMMKKMGGQMPGGLGESMQFGKSGAKVYVESKTGKTFADVAGQDEAKDSLKEVVDFLHDPEKYADIGAKCPKGVLLVGPPGTGKTLLAEAVAGEAKVPFFSISGSEFVEMFVGMGAAKVRDLFKQANEKAPCIVFIDEIDTIGKKRGDGAMGGNDEREQTLNQLLAEMDGFDSSKGVVLLAATNRPDSLDPALLRPGRFDRRVPVELPDLKGREAILKVHGKDVKMSEDVNFADIAKATPGASGAELANIINEAALRAVRMGRQIVMQEDMEESVETVIAGAQRKSAVLSVHEKKIVSYHEMGHALVAAMQTHSAPVTKVTIIPRTSGALGYTMQVDQGERNLMSRAEMENRIITFTGGRAAEELIFGEKEITNGASNDIEQATKMARAMITRYGMTDDFDMVALETLQNRYLGGDASLSCSDATAARVDAKVVDVVKSSHQKALAILKENEPKLHQLARYLYEKETITGDEFMKILDIPADNSKQTLAAEDEKNLCAAADDELKKVRM